MEENTAMVIVEEVFLLYSEKGEEEYHGEPISQLQHMLQAATLAQNGNFDDEIILAAFFHDIGHLLGSNETMGSYGIKDHERLGAQYLADRGFSEKIVQLVASHVEAKRYFSAIDTSYYNRLSPASKATLEYQGGPMRQEEVKNFNKNPLKDIILTFRRWDEAAKVPGKETISINALKNMARRHLVNNSTQD